MFVCFFFNQFYTMATPDFTTLPVADASPQLTSLHFLCLGSGSLHVLMLQPPLCREKNILTRSLFLDLINTDLGARCWVENLPTGRGKESMYFLSPFPLSHKESFSSTVPNQKEPLNSKSLPNTSSVFYYPSF